MIAILDYGSGNLRSAQRAFATSGVDVVVTSDRATALEADGLVVPGVGAFAACMQGLGTISGEAIIRERIEKERAVLGICIGMQILFQEGSEHAENGNHRGVGVWEGEVSRLKAPILPHMGWNSVESDPNSILLKGVAGESFYFVHSYAAKKAVGKVQGWSFHGEKFLSVVEDGYVCATQFHPEKSGDAGLVLIKNWVKSL
ncbi:MAG: imidazole glycerol phosphate synthase subunit HisH [Actinomycetales bacterium]|nr:imidazole glycerol phosphate synthase subunit HisH [Actinomycetales bacterium]